MATFAIVTDTRAITHPEGGYSARFLSQVTGGVCDGITKARKFGTLTAAAGLMIQRGPCNSGVVAFRSGVPGIMSVVLSLSALDHIIEALWVDSSAKRLYDGVPGSIETMCLPRGWLTRANARAILVHGRDTSRPDQKRPDHRGGSHDTDHPAPQLTRNQDGEDSGAVQQCEESPPGRSRRNRLR